MRTGEMARAISRCPDCGEPVTPFAAGCAICGADIAAARAARERRRAAVDRFGGGLRVPSLGDDGLRIVIAVLVTLAAPFIGVLLDSWFAWQLHQEGRLGMRNAMLALAVLGVVSLMEPFWLWRLLSGR
jgi:hypothetical protein